MTKKTLWKTPAPSSGFLEGVSFKVLPKRVCVLSFQYENADAQPRSCEIRFSEVAAFKCTYLISLTKEMVESSYDELIDYGGSQWLDEAKAEAKLMAIPGRSSPDLKHFRICFDDGPCYEFLCAKFEVMP